MRQLLTLVCLLWALGFYTQEHQVHHHKASEVSQAISYTCPMHPEVVSEHPGKCPKCGMDLVKKESQTQGKSAKELQRYGDNGKVNFDGKVVRYDLYVTDTIVNFTGKPRHAIAINGQIPGPTLYFTEGDIAEIHLHNRLKNEATGLHWHGVMLENQYDGVLHLTQMPVAPGDDFVYHFKVSQNGTYWYHSHKGLQEQIGMYGVLVFKPRENQRKKAPYVADIPVILSEWSDEKPEEILRRLRTGQTEWYAIKKGSVQSYSEAIASGNFWTKLKNEWKRMEAMDISDVYYEKFLLNGLPAQQYKNLKAGDKVRLRLVNGGSSSYFWVDFAGGPMTVIASDGNRVEPVKVDRLIMGVSETYDVIVEIPENKSFELRATPEDRSGHSSLWLGEGEKVYAQDLEKLQLFEGMKAMNYMMKMSGDMKPMSMKMGLQQFDMNAVMYPEVPKEKRTQIMQHVVDMLQPQKESEKQTAHSKHNSTKEAPPHQHHASEKEPVILNYAMLRSPMLTELPEEAPIKELNFVLEGNMEHYLWTLNNKTVAESDKILIKKGQVVRMTLYNNSMMRHPMHLHGHDFRIINPSGAYSPMKNVVDIMPMETVVIEFPANQDGDWFFHCHILYHMAAGMGRVFHYENSKPNPFMQHHSKDAWRMFKGHHSTNAFTGSLALEYPSAHAEASVSSTRYALMGELHTGFKDDFKYEAEVKLGRYLGKFQWAMPYIGFESRSGIGHGNRKTWLGQDAQHDQRNVFVVGFQYVLPWLVTADASVNHKGKVRLQLEREDIPLSPRLRGNAMVNTDREYRFGLRYILQKWLSVSSHYDSDLGWSAGLTLTY